MKTIKPVIWIFQFLFLSIILPILISFFIFQSLSINLIIKIFLTFLILTVPTTINLIWKKVLFYNISDSPKLNLILNDTSFENFIRNFINDLTKFKSKTTILKDQMSFIESYFYCNYLTLINELIGKKHLRKKNYLNLIEKEEEKILHFESITDVKKIQLLQAYYLQNYN
ncbi:hypothetical protein [Mesoplasma florum]|uniref:hypothetical protein n=1 Tax=Mesoplasma florum TaxID=2151 RepID=UPI00131A2D30|nr:hypothetical protein [Mesoplasma florum]